MTETKNILQTLSKRLGDKAVSISKDEAAIGNLEKQIALFQNSIVTKRGEIEKKGAERDLISDLMAEAEGLVKEHTKLIDYTAFLVAKYEAIEWTPDMPYEDKLESTDYAEKTAEKFAIEDRLKDILKEANKIYFRR